MRQSSEMQEVKSSRSVVYDLNDWMVRNAKVLQSLEMVLYILPQFVPKKMLHPDVANEASYSLVGLLQLHRDITDMKSIGQLNDGTTQDDLFRNLANHRIQTILTLIQSIQVTVEVIFVKYVGEKQKSKMICALEGVKCFLKLILLARYKSGLLYKGGKITRRADDDKRSANSNPMDLFTGKRSGKKYVLRRKKGDEKSTSKEQKEVQHPFYGPICPESTTENPIQLIGELLHVLHPIVYVLSKQFLNKEGNDKKSWAPLLLSLSLEVCGIVCTSTSLAKNKPNQSPMSFDELRRRKMCLLMYLLRSPAFDIYSKPVLDRLCRTTDFIPLGGTLFRFVIQNYVYYYNQYHFANANS